MAITAKNKEEIMRNAYNTIQSKWNSNIAVKRLLSISEKLLTGQDLYYYDEGPCSKA